MIVYNKEVSGALEKFLADNNLKQPDVSMLFSFTHIEATGVFKADFQEENRYYDARIFFIVPEQVAGTCFLLPSEYNSDMNVMYFITLSPEEIMKFLDKFPKIKVFL